MVIKYMMERNMVRWILSLENVQLITIKLCDWIRSNNWIFLLKGCDQCEIWFYTQALEVGASRHYKRSLKTNMKVRMQRLLIINNDI